MNLYWTRVRRFSPILCRLLARHRYGKPLTTNEITMRCFLLSSWQVEQLSQATSWEGVSLDHFREFTQATGVDPSDAQAMRRIEDYLASKPKFSFLKRDHNLWKQYYRPLMQRWLNAQAATPTKTSSAPPSPSTKPS